MVIFMESDFINNSFFQKWFFWKKAMGFWFSVYFLTCTFLKYFRFIATFLWCIMIRILINIGVLIVSMKDMATFLLFLFLFSYWSIIRCDEWYTSVFFHTQILLSRCCYSLEIFITFFYFFILFLLINRILNL